MGDDEGDDEQEDVVCGGWIIITIPPSAVCPFAAIDSSPCLSSRARRSLQKGLRLTCRRAILSPSEARRAYEDAANTVNAPHLAAATVTSPSSSALPSAAVGSGKVLRFLERFMQEGLSGAQRDGVAAFLLEEDHNGQASVK